MFALTSGRPPRGLAKLVTQLNLTTARGGVQRRRLREARSEDGAGAADDRTRRRATRRRLSAAGGAGRLGVPGLGLVRAPRGSAARRARESERGISADRDPRPDHGARSADQAGRHQRRSGAGRALRAELAARLGTGASAARSQPYFLDITHPEANKGMVVREASRILKIPLHEIATIGDMSNDVPMLTVAGMGIAMGNASPDVQAVARHVTASNEQDGFAHAVDTFILGQPPFARTDLGLPPRTRGCLFGLEGVLAQTTRINVEAWKRLFDDYLRLRARAGHQPFVPFDAVQDYAQHIQGRGAQAAIRSFLDSARHRAAGRDRRGSVREQGGDPDRAPRSKAARRLRRVAGVPAGGAAVGAADRRRLARRPLPGRVAIGRHRRALRRLHRRSLRRRATAGGATGAGRPSGWRAGAGPRLRRDRRLRGRPRRDRGGTGGALRLRRRRRSRRAAARPASLPAPTWW